MQAQSLKDINTVKAMKNLPVLVIGDIMLDRFVYGSVERISPESPVPVLSISRENKMLGGAGNTLINLVHLKCDARIISVIGDDENGQCLEGIIKQHNMQAEGLIRLKDRPTIVKTRFLAGHQQLLRTDFERIEIMPEAIQDQILQKAEKLMQGVKALILSDYGKGMLTPALLEKLIKQAKAKNIPVLVDPKGSDYAIYRGADVVTPNKKELSQATGGMAVKTDKEIISAAQHLLKQSGIGAVVATRSKEGISVIQGQGEEDITHIASATEIEVFDVSGAGDTVIATVAAALATGATLVEAASLANVAGSIVVSKVGTAPIRAEELLECLKKHDPAGDVISGKGAREAASRDRTRQAPVHDWDKAREEIQRWKARGLSVGFTNGCFDILHFGHVNYLNEARARCDRLIVGLNTDSSVKILKGADRPVHNEESRASVLAALGAVDMVVLFGAEQSGDDNTACALLECLQPDIYFKGGDYTPEQIPEAPTVRKYGGKIDVMPVYEGHSTTGSIAKMRDPKVA